ncbi:MAG: hypothetical protein DRI72_06935, partial [Bacteroidetes bacterium]
MKILYTLICLFLFINTAFTQNSNLFKRIEPKKIEKEIASKNISFVWVYAPNSCSYSKDSVVFENKEVVKFYSTFFNCYSISIDTLKNIDFEQIEINKTKTGYYFIDSSLTIVHKNLKGQSTPDDLIRLGNTALDTIRRYDAIIQRYNDGNRDVKFLLQYLKTRKNAKELTSKDIDLFVSFIDTSNVKQAEVREFIYDYFFCRTYDNGYSYFSPVSVPFNILINQRDLLIQEYDTLQIDLRINALLEFGLKELVQQKDLDLIEKSAKFFNDTIQTYELKDTDGYTLLYLTGKKNDTINKLQALKTFYYLQAGDTTNALYNEKEYLRIAQNSPSGLFFIANYYFRNIGNLLYINKSEEILNNAYKLAPDDYSI